MVLTEFHRAIDANSCGDAERQEYGQWIDTLPGEDELPGKDMKFLQTLSDTGNTPVYKRHTLQNATSQYGEVTWAGLVHETV